MLNKIFTLLMMGACSMSGLSNEQSSTHNEPTGLLDKLIAPGPLSPGHKNLENSGCFKCHEGTRGTPGQKCLSCHQEIKNNKNSFHARQTQPCNSCHIMHGGVDKAVAKIDTKTFDHATTGYPLWGSHASIRCATCHLDRHVGNDSIKYHGKTASCNDCHLKDAPHKFPDKWAKRGCDSCHQGHTFKTNIVFSHENATGFPLQGQHKKLECQQCHTPLGNTARKYNFTHLKQDGCLTCHKNYHAGATDARMTRGNQCLTCHNYDSFRGQRFNHNTTGFKLQGPHQKLACAACHTRPGAKINQWPNLARDGCLACHKNYHAGAKDARMTRGDQCLTCHSNFSFKAQRFNHTTTGFSLDGAHQKLACAACHTKPGAKINQWPDLSVKGCAACHGSPHQGNGAPRVFARPCSTCHNTSTFKDRQKFLATFDHNRDTGFKLTNKHASSSCESCHLKQRKFIYKFAERGNGLCTNCHTSPHHGAPYDQQSCLACHNTASFNPVAGSTPRAIIDHNKTRFPLDGAHLHIKDQCQKCHGGDNGKPANYHFKSASQGFCQDCHQNPHRGQFHAAFAAMACRDCHNTSSFADHSSFNHAKTRFPLSGHHTQLTCQQCHPQTSTLLTNTPPRYRSQFILKNFQNTKNSCISCHKSPHPHGAAGKAFNKPCLSCHTDVSFKTGAKPTTTSFNHTTSTNFPLTGKHAVLTCQNCHEQHGKQVYRFADNNRGRCLTCHGDPHRGQFDAKYAQKPCEECHSTKSFSNIKAFDHSKTPFALDGKHAAIANRCERCHPVIGHDHTAFINSNIHKFVFAGSAAGFCADCHKNPHSDQFAAPFNSMACSSCHTNTSFADHSKFNHNSARFHLKGAHTKLPCNRCHTPTNKLLAAQPPRYQHKFLLPGITQQNCAACHAQRTPHPQGFSTDCASCHNEASFKKGTIFHQNFQLTGVHRELSCNECHIQGRKLTAIDNDCRACHAKDDIHRGGLPHCNDCHGQVDWLSSHFHHANTGFPLHGVHRTLDCDNCHRTGIYQGLPAYCSDCHAKDARTVTTPNHNSAGYLECQTCHNQFDWQKTK